VKKTPLHVDNKPLSQDKVTLLPLSGGRFVLNQRKDIGSKALFIKLDVRSQESQAR
jgi:hypothetical protein